MNYSCNTPEYAHRHLFTNVAKTTLAPTPVVQFYAISDAILFLGRLGADYRRNLSIKGSLFVIDFQILIDADITPKKTRRISRLLCLAAIL